VGVEVVATACLQEAKAIEELTAERDPTYQLTSRCSEQAGRACEVRQARRSDHSGSGLHAELAMLPGLPQAEDKGHTSCSLTHTACSLRRASGAVDGRLDITLWGETRGIYEYIP
jgi:hypothetical protein